MSDGVKEAVESTCLYCGKVVWMMQARQSRGIWRLVAFEAGLERAHECEKPRLTSRTHDRKTLVQPKKQKMLGPRPWAWRELDADG